MYVFLLLLGCVTALAGISLVASGVSSHAGDAALVLITPGTVAFVGGLLLIGFALAVRVLQRIERSLTAPPMPRPARAGDAVALAASEAANQPARIPFPPKPKTEPHPQPAPVAALPSAAATEDVGLEQFGEIFPALVRTDSAPVVEEADVLLLPNSPSRSVEELGEVANGRAAERTNGATAPRIVPRPQANPRPGRMPDPRKVSMFEIAVAEGRAGRARRSGCGCASPRTTAGHAGPRTASSPTRATRRADAGCSACTRPTSGATDAGFDPQIRGGRRNGLHALLGRFDRGAAAAGHVAVRLDHRTAQSHRAQLIAPRLRS